jgi:integral membrane protein
MKKIFHPFRKIAIAEGISFLVLLCIAMPMKYFARIPIAVTIVGSLHGILFIAFIVLALEVKDEPVVAGWKKNFNWIPLVFLRLLFPLALLY